MQSEQREVASATGLAWTEIASVHVSALKAEKETTVPNFYAASKKIHAMKINSAMAKLRNANDSLQMAVAEAAEGLGTSPVSKSVDKTEFGVHKTHLHSC